MESRRHHIQSKLVAPPILSGIVGPSWSVSPKNLPSEPNVNFLSAKRKLILLWIGPEIGEASGLGVGHPVRSVYSELDPSSPSANAVNAGTNASAAPMPTYHSFLNRVLKEPMDATSVGFRVGRRQSIGVGHHSVTNLENNKKVPGGLPELFYPR